MCVWNASLENWKIIRFETISSVYKTHELIISYIYKTTATIQTTP